MRFDELLSLFLQGEQSVLLPAALPENFKRHLITLTALAIRQIEEWWWRTDCLPFDSTLLPVLANW